jgi:hypothetical protein
MTMKFCIFIFYILTPRGLSWCVVWKLMINSKSGLFCLIPPFNHNISKILISLLCVQYHIIISS